MNTKRPRSDITTQMNYTARMLLIGKRYSEFNEAMFKRGFPWQDFGEAKSLSLYEVVSSRYEEFFSSGRARLGYA